MKKIFLVFCMGALFLSLGASEKPATTTKKTMNSVLKGFLGLVPFMSDPMKFKDPSNKEEIHTHLSTIKNAFSNAKHLKTFKLPGFSPSYEQVKTHLFETLEAFESGQPDFARVRVRATGQLCISCHTQLKGNKGSFGLISSVTRNDFSSDFEYAEFLFLVRNYQKAQRYYEKEIIASIKKSEELAKITKGAKSPYQGSKIEDSLEKILTIHTKVKLSPSNAITLLQKYEANKSLNEETITRVKEWNKSLRIWEKEKVSVNTTKELDAFLNKHVQIFNEQVSMYDGSHDVTLLVASGVLYRLLHKKPNSEDAPKLLYWISKIDRLLSNTYLFSLSDLYLKKCITGYSKSPWARKCYEAYKDELSHGYTGSSGTFIPQDEKKELKRLKGFID